MRRVITVLVLVVSLAGLGGCVVRPAPGYYARPAYGGFYAPPPRPAYRPYYRRW